MEAVTKRIKHVTVAILLFANVSGAAAATPAHAYVNSGGGIDPNPTTQVSPKLTDAGSSYWTVEVDGSGFSKNNYVLIQARDEATGNIVLSEIIQTSPAICLFGSCWGGGTFSYTGYPSKTSSQCHPGREVRAYDFGLGAWVNPLHVGCK
jgi:hypothetical protein